MFNKTLNHKKTSKNNKKTNQKRNKTPIKNQMHKINLIHKHKLLMCIHMVIIKEEQTHEDNT